MASGKGCDKEQNMGFGKGWDPEKMLRLYVYDYMKKKGLHDTADIFSKEANLEMSTVLDSDRGLLKEWWDIFWPQFSSTLADKAGENSQSFTQPSVQDVQPSVQDVQPSVQDVQPSVQDVQPSVQDVQPSVQDAQPSMQDAQPSRQDVHLSMQDVLALLASLEKQGDSSSQHTPDGNPQHSMNPTPVANQQMIASGGSAVVNVMEQPPASLVQNHPSISQRRAGKRPMNTDSDSTLGQSSAHAIQKGTRGFPPVKLLQNQLPFDANQMAYTMPPPSRSTSNPHLPVTMQSPVQITRDPRNDVVAERSDQMESNRVGRNSAYPAPGLHADFSEFLKKYFKG